MSNYGYKKKSVPVIFEPPCIFIKVLNSKFHRKPSYGSRADPCGQKDRQTDRRTNGRNETKEIFVIMQTSLKTLRFAHTVYENTNVFRTVLTTNSYYTT